jgi:FKBP-type peptidyl-prolyl cis-trans isomerase FkpA
MEQVCRGGPYEMRKARWLRLSLGGMLILVALIAVVIAYLRPDNRRIIDVKIGTGPPVKPGDTITVHYTGKLTGGKTFDSSKARGQPFVSVVGRGMVIRGWDAGLVGMRVGGIRRLNIPPEQAYGDRGVPPVIPPKATLHFEVELLKIE